MGKELEVNVCSFSKRKVVDGIIPEPRSGHRLVEWEGSLYVLGGYNPRFWQMDNDEDTNYPLLKELWKFNLATQKWKRLQTTGPMPKELASHAATLYGHHMVVIGGTGIPFGESSSNQVYVCNLKTLRWTHLECQGEPPSPCYGHGMQVYDDCIVMFGGTSGWMYNAEVHTLNLHTREWTPIETKGEEPDGRYRHEIAIHNDKMYVFGGGRAYVSHHFQLIPVLDLEKWHWSSMKSKSDPVNGYPPARRCHAAVYINNAAYICGGYNGTEIFGDLWQLNLDTLQWKELATNMPEPAYFHDATVTKDGEMFIYGGVTQIDSERTSSVYSSWLQVPSLKTQCWNFITGTTPKLYKNSKCDLIAAGFPQHCVDNLLS